MASSSPSLLSTEELRSFHRIDRKLYSRLVINLQKDFIQCMQVLAFWLWLEDYGGYPALIPELLPLADQVLNLVFDEAVRSLSCIGSPPYLSSSSSTINIPITQQFTGNPIISLQILHSDKIQASRRIYTTVSDVCFRTFDDIVEHAFSNEEKECSSGGGAVLPVQLPVLQESIWTPRVGTKEVNLSSTFFGSGFRPVMMSQHPLLGGVPMGSGPLNPMAEPWDAPTNKKDEDEVDVEVPEEERTMFFTFSRGYPITIRELKSFFGSLHGDDCIEAIHMQEVTGKRQPLFARVVFRSASIVAAILDGKDRVKYVINGKHVWTRIFVDKSNEETTS